MRSGTADRHSHDERTPARCPRVLRDGRRSRAPVARSRCTGVRRSKELIGRFLTTPGIVADVGGAAGHYADWLARKGHRVELVDPVTKLVELARKRAGDPPRFVVHVADARELPFEDESFDAVLLLGPLYHLAEDHARVQALREARRVCQQGGLVFAAAISRFAPLLDTIRRGRLAEEDLVANVRAETRTGRRVAADRRRSPFPDAYFHLPEELHEEVGQAELDVLGVYGVEGPGWLFSDFESVWEDEVSRERILSIARDVEATPHLVAVSAHLLAVARKTS